MAVLVLAALAFRFHKRHPTVLAHATGVLGLTILLGLI
jgi:heme A synthase